VEKGWVVKCNCIRDRDRKGGGYIIDNMLFVSFVLDLDLGSELTIR